MRTTAILLFATIALILQGCTKDDLDPALFGTWQVTRVEGLYYINNSPTFPLSDNSPSGTVRFDRNGTGRQDYSFQLLGNTNTQTGAFKWTATDTQILIDLKDDPDMVWQRVTKLTNKQVATYTHVVDGSTRWDYTLTLEK
jgi:hypothetical protein